MKLIVQIPCHNEAETLPSVVADIPREIPGIDRVEILVIDDGSTDGTSEVARQHGVDHVVQNLSNQGLARTFGTGLDAALRLGADIIVNTDGDNQYPGADIPKLVAPIVASEADIVIGNRQTSEIAGFSPVKKLLQKLGSSVVARMSGIDVPDAVSGFRAFSREAALNTNIFSTFSYTIETLIQAGRKHFTVVSVPIGINAVTRPSRLYRNIPHFIFQSVSTMVRVYAMYRPLRVFMYIGTIFVVLGSIPVIRFVFYYLSGAGDGKIQSLILGGTLITIGGLSLMFGMLADLISFNRQLSEMTLERVRQLEMRIPPTGDSDTKDGKFYRVGEAPGMENGR